MGSLNHVFRTIWSEVLGTWIAVSEITKAKGKRSGSSIVRAIRAVVAESDAAHERGARLKPILFALACCFVVDAQANPEGGVVVSGSASFNAVGNTLTVTNTPGTIINWQGFSINANEVTHFAQQSAASAVLNRVVSNNPSAILGTLSSNGQVYLVNPNGIVFGSGATVDVAGLVATSLNLSDADFLAGRHNYTDQAGAQNISNAGNINAQQGGQIFLIAPNVENTGIITAPNGEILLVAGHEVQLVNSLDPGLRVSIVAPAGEATNLGQLIVQSGSLGLFGAVVRNTGAVSADSATLQGGKIVFKSSQRTEVGGTVTATGTNGGTIEVLSSNEVRVSAGASIDASGTNGGGTILVGGDRQGLNPDVVNAKTTYVDATASIKADAVQNGDGGKVIVWADDATHAHGSITAQGGANGGNGGFVETSAHYLDVAGISVDASASKGKGGEWLLDPSDVHISAGTQFGGTFSNGIWTPSAATSWIDSGTILGALDAGTSVTVMTASAAAGNGDIFVDAPIDKTAGTAATLTLLAERNITFANGTGISSTTGALNVVLRSDADANGTGTVSFAGANTLNALAGGRVDLYYNPSSYATPTTFTGINWGATAHTEWMLVNNVTNLQAMNTNLTGNYALGAAIDATVTSTWNLGSGFVPIGTPAGLADFKGMFDGMGHTIDGLYINRSAESYIGLFGFTTGSTIKNVTLTNVNITGGTHVGGLAGWHQGALAGSHVLTGSVTAIGNYAGGLVGMNYNNSTIDSSSAGATVSGASYVGGLIGASQQSTLTNVSATGNVTGTNWGAGGLVGSMDGDASPHILTNGTASGNVNGSRYVGGLVGWNGYLSTINNGIASGDVTSTLADAGGLVGMNAYIITGSHATGNVTGVANVGGLVGNNTNDANPSALRTYGSVINSYANTGAVTGTTNVGGLVGQNTLSTSINTSNAGGAVSGFTNVGGLVGYNYRGSVSTSFATGVVTPSNANSVSMGGLVGDNSGTISDSYVTTTNVTGYMYVGGLVGFNHADTACCYVNEILNSYVSGGSVTGSVSTGGLVGYNTGTLNNSHYNINGVTVNGANHVTLGGLYNDNLVNALGIGQYSDWLSDKFLNIADYATVNGGSFGNGGIGIYTISNVSNAAALLGLKDMLGFTDDYLNTFTLTGNVDLATLPGFYVPIMASSFNGAGFTISNLSVNLDTANLGLFGVVDSFSTVSNVSLLDASVISSAPINGDNIGALAGLNKGTINSSSAGTTVGGTTTVSGFSSVGGLVGNNTGTINTSTFFADSGGTASVTGGSNVGGLVGTHYSLSAIFIHDSGVYANSGGAVNVTGVNYVGGLVGYLDGALDYSYVSNATINAIGANIGGLAGSVLQVPIYSYFNVDGVTTNGGNNVTRGGLYSGQYNTWLSAGRHTPLLIGSYSTSLPLQLDGSYGISNLQGMQDMLAFADDSLIDFSLLGSIDLAPLPGFSVPVLAGSFFGNNFNISNLSIDLPNFDMGLFGNINFGTSVVMDLNLVNASVRGNGNVGALAGLNYGTIDNVSVTGTTSVISVFSQSDIGGLVGLNNRGNISNSDVTGATVSGSTYVGGLVGYNQGSWSSSGGSISGIITNCFVSSGSVTGTAGNIGGLAGFNFGGAILDSHVTNPTVVGGASSSVGGLVGLNRGGSNSVYQGPTMGFVDVYYGEIGNSYVSGGTVSSSGNSVGGLVGNVFGGRVEGSWVDSVSVTGGMDVGGLVGFDSGEGFNPGVALINNSHSINTQVTGNSHVGGLVGYLGITTGFSNVNDNSFVVTNSYVSGGTVSSNSTSLAAGTGIGGLVGYNFESNVRGSYVNNGTVVTGGFASNVGGLVGYNTGGGALIGRIVESYASGGAVSGYGNVGGLVGFNAGTILRTYAATATVSGPTAGGLVGYNSVSANVDNSFWDTDTTGFGNANGFGNDLGYLNTSNVLGRTSIQARTQADVEAVFGVGTVANAGGAALTWRIYEGQTAPLLTSFLTQLVITADAASKTYDGAVYSGGLVNPTYTDGVNPVVPNLPDILGTANAYGPNAINVGTYAPALYSGQQGYDISYVGGLLTIGTASLSVISLNGTRVYDGTANVDWSIFTLAGLIGSQTLTLSGVGTVADANVGINKPVTLGTLALGDGTNGGLASNYTLAGGTHRATITAAPLTIGGSNVAPKVYDGTVSATVGAGVLSGLVGVETLGVSASGAFINKNVGTAKNVTVTYALSDGTGLASNYILPGETLTADITALPVTLTLPSLTKTYDGGLGYTLTAADRANLSGALVGGDVVNAANITYLDKNAGGGKTVTFNSVAINDGNGGGNYSISLVGNSTSIINQENLIVAAMNLNKVLGTPDPELSYLLFGLHDPVAATLSGTLTRIAGDTIGTYAINQGSVTLLDTTNYYMTYVPGVFTILAPTVVQEITEISLLNTPQEDGPLTTEEEEKKLIEQLAAAGMINADEGAITEPLPLCR